MFLTHVSDGLSIVGVENTYTHFCILTYIQHIMTHTHTFVHMHKDTRTHTHTHTHTHGAGAAEGAEAQVGGSGGRRDAGKAPILCT